MTRGNYSGVNGPPHPDLKGHLVSVADVEEVLQTSWGGNTNILQHLGGDMTPLKE